MGHTVSVAITQGAEVEQNQPSTKCKQMGVAVLQQNLFSKDKK